MKYGLIGEKLGHSFSPRIHKTIFELSGINGEYELIELKRDEVGNFFCNARKQGFSGLNVTIPYKTDVIPYMQKLSPEAEKIGAVNTISLEGYLAGFNTDYFGIKYTFMKSGVRAAGKTALIAGSGGASRSVLAYLMDEKASKIYIASRNPEKVSIGHESIIPVGYSELSKYTPFDIVINTTPVGMYPNTAASPLKPEHVEGSEFLFDLIYNPAVTELLAIGQKLGIKTVNGLYMLVAQAVKAQEIWNGKEFGIDFVDSVYSRVAGLK
ncbi:shikimate dehydrogenase AroE [Thermoclostridium stercorarium subsp. stercorarium DSM 8532]|uniref:Shikimate dehydrogenase (NADP(+)) n=2 Tax=Thermoclostridium stercorarium TaxID=1510 RepID=L7VNE7_THES1|nr:shikimate dehydrogenase [Thermoclostridium stercorarium]AGC68287.1 shikimate dehydrogenase AroE [Thermoclostridium stercorarium subsp. stercorarium DSM 8532]AGI39316.1 shikimate dehydrogenase [Thermoclostridium stercorarium subsp. stercorarium DSM 8532]ANW98644.1 shikimate dehydrogenase [Thermoclostridium stercorarium subsp. thermolacticum DSM 2910]UZQ86798.1 shikimate dehydrogenase [Thermoclostridium stercorarium]